MDASIKRWGGGDGGRRGQRRLQPSRTPLAVRRLVLTSLAKRPFPSWLPFFVLAVLAGEHGAGVGGGDGGRRGRDLRGAGGGQEQEQPQRVPLRAVAQE